MDGIVKLSIIVMDSQRVCGLVGVFQSHGSLFPEFNFYLKQHCMRGGKPLLVIYILTNSKCLKKAKLSLRKFQFSNKAKKRMMVQ